MAYSKIVDNLLAILAIRSFMFVSMARYLLRGNSSQQTMHLASRVKSISSILRFCPLLIDSVILRIGYLIFESLANSLNSFILPISISFGFDILTC